MITIGPGLPSRYCIDVNAHALARFAALSQEAGLVPIVEPEVLMDGDHSIVRCFEVTEATQRRVFEELAAQRVSLEGMLLKPNMVLSGKEAAVRADAAGVAEATLACFRRTVPAAVPGVVFLSGGQGDEEATVNLDAINRLAQAQGGAPWQLSYSYGRGLQATPLRAWGGDPARVAAAQAAFQERAQATSAARQGAYRPAPATGRRLIEWACRVPAAAPGPTTTQWRRPRGGGCSSRRATPARSASSARCSTPAAGMS